MMIVHISVHTREFDNRTKVGVEPILSYMDMFQCVFIVTASSVMVLASFFKTRFAPSVSITLCVSDFLGTKTHTYCI